MKTLINVLLPLVILVPNLFCQELPYHPFRKVRDSYYDLRPLYSWIESAKALGAKHEEFPSQHLRPRPMKEWYGVTEPYEGILVHYEVFQVLDDGLLVRETRFNPASGDTVEGNLFFLRNYPGFKSLTDDQKIRFLALRTGVYKYTDTSGAVRTIPLYDYGIPYDPWALAKQQTNSVNKGEIHNK